MKLNVLLLCAWPFRLDVVADQMGALGASVLYQHILLATIGITSSKSRNLLMKYQQLSL